MRQIDFVFVVLPDKTDAVFKNRHHSQSEQIDFNDAQIRAIVLVPLHDSTAWHRRLFEWNDGVQLTLANDQASRMLAKMTGQILNANTNIEELANAWMRKIESVIAKLVFERIRSVAVFPGSNQSCQAFQYFWGKAKHLASLTRCGAASMLPVSRRPTLNG